EHRAAVIETADDELLGTGDEAVILRFLKGVTDLGELIARADEDRVFDLLPVVEIIKFLDGGIDLHRYFEMLLQILRRVADERRRVAGDDDFPAGIGDGNFMI